MCHCRHVMEESVREYQSLGQYEAESAHICQNEVCNHVKGGAESVCFGQREVCWHVVVLFIYWQMG